MGPAGAGAGAGARVKKLNRVFLLPAASPVAALLPGVGGEPPQVSPGNIQKVAVFQQQPAA